jgi:hypothetical protein
MLAVMEARMRQATLPQPVGCAISDGTSDGIHLIRRRFGVMYRGALAQDGGIAEN